jgi:hypothetical protein
MRTPSTTTLALLLGLAAAAGAQVDCSNPDNLCTGDPCVIPVIEPANPCTVNFGTRELVIEGLRNVESVDFRARKITVAGPVRGRPAVGGSLALTADGELTLDGPIEFSGESIVALDAIDELIATAPIRLSGGDDTPLDSSLTLHSQTRIQLEAPIVNVGGADSVDIAAMGGVGVDRITNRRKGTGPQPSLSVSGLGVSLNGALSADGPVGIGGELDVDVRAPVRVGGPYLHIDGAEETMSIAAPIKSTGRANGGRCGAITLHAGKGAPIVDAPIVCAGRAGGDGITIIGSGIQVNSTLKTVSKDAASGDIVLDTGANVIVTGEILARGSRPGDVIVTGGTVTFEDARVNSSSRLGGGAQRYTASDGNVALQGDFVASKGSTIQATATGDVITDGDFGVGEGGCIGLSAGGSVSLGSSVFDQTPTTSCP